MEEEEEGRQVEEVQLEEVERFQKSIRVEGDVADFNYKCIEIWRMLLLVFFFFYKNQNQIWESKQKVRCYYFANIDDHNTLV